MGPEQQKIVKWVGEVLKPRDDEKIDVEFPEYDTSGGYAAEVIFVNVYKDKNGKKEKLELIVKKNKENMVDMDILNLKTAYESETKVYRKVVPIFNKLAEEENSKIFENIPTCYGTICRDNEYVIIMENLKSKGYKTHDLEVAQDLHHVKLVLEAYANWHAFCLALNEEQREILKEFGHFTKVLLEGKMFGFMINTVENELNWLIEKYKTKNKQYIIEKIQSLKKIYPGLFTETFKYENHECIVLRHGDSWNNNFLFHYDNKIPDKAVIIDWQISVLGSPTIDLVNFIFLNCSRKELEHLPELLKFYYGILSKKLRELGGDPEKTLPWDKFVKSFKHFAPTGIAMITLAAKMSHKVENGPKYDIAQSIHDENFAGILGDTMRDPEGCFDRINDILEFCIQENYL